MSEPWSGPSAEQLKAIQQLSPEAVDAHLASEGWRARTAAREASLWTLTEGADEFEIMVPTDRRMRDFSLRMYDVLRTLAVIEDRPLSAVISELMNTGSDRMIFRLLPSGPPGTIPLLNGTEALRGVREIVIASTYASTLDRPLLVQGKRPAIVWDFAREVRLGTPRAGSWVIAAEVAIPEADLGPGANGSQPFARRVSLQVHRGVRATFAAAGEALRGNSLEPFLRRAKEGVSANVCDALASLGRDNTPFEVRFEWAQRLPSSIGAGRFRFDSQVIRTIRSAGEELRNSMPEGPVEITGPVARLSREGTQAGMAVISGLVHTRYGEAEQNVKVPLTATQHELAIEAYRSRRHVRVTGEARQGRVAVVRHVEVMARDPDDHRR
ncbi:hypothetical protein [Micromonospora sp. NPDC023737]|uniref:hypothetical protein n=1 Tax=unclassified Micromonospora TaxID=2617518 RepID=UPI0033E2EAF2